MSSYEEFLKQKKPVVYAVGIDKPPELHTSMFPFQVDVTKWALRRGRAALWLDTGLGKSVCAIEWARVICEHTGGKVLILTPLAVAQQFVTEGKRVGVDVNLCREPEDVKPGVNVTNYDRLERFLPIKWDGVVLDESSCLKDFTSATRNLLIDGFADVRFKLACSATPAPNDHTEIGNHSEFLGVMSRLHMLSAYFVNGGEKTQDWMLKGHAKKDFWAWVAQWAVAIRKPSDIGYENDGYDLPPLNIIEHICETDSAALAKENGLLFGYEANTLSDLRAARRSSLSERVKVVADMVNASDEPWICWTDLNKESEELTKLIDGAVEVTGSDKPEHKEERIIAFANGKTKAMVTKPGIAGAGLNMQVCHNMAFAGLSFSWERFYQAIRRCYRFGQTKPVNVHIVTSQAEMPVLQSIRRKQMDADAMADGMVKHMRDITRASLGKTVGKKERVKVDAKKVVVPSWLQR